jgi:hypothetical protein
MMPPFNITEDRRYYGSLFNAKCIKVFLFQNKFCIEVRQRTLHPQLPKS